jgi:hypothetical protein
MLHALYEYGLQVSICTIGWVLLAQSLRLGVPRFACRGRAVASTFWQGTQYAHSAPFLILQMAATMYVRHTLKSLVAVLLTCSIDSVSCTLGPPRCSQPSTVMATLWSQGSAARLFNMLSTIKPEAIPMQQLLNMAERAMNEHIIPPPERTAALLANLADIFAGLAAAIRAQGSALGPADQQRAIQLSLRALQYSGTRPCSTACLSLWLP